MEHRWSCCSSPRPRRSVQRQGTLPNNALHLTTARPQKECAVAGERERSVASLMLLKSILVSLILAASSGGVLAQRRSIPVCPKPADAEKLVGFEIKFLVPKDTVVNHARDIDYEAWAIDFGSGRNHIQLQAFSGLNVGNGEVHRDLITASRKFSLRYWRHNKLAGVDAKGQYKNDRFWRYLGMYGETIRYYDAPADAVAYFDRILDSACFPN